MDGFRLRIQKRLEYLTAFKARLTHQWELIKQYCLIERPRQLQTLLQLRMRQFREHFLKFVDKIEKSLEHRWNIARENATRISFFLFRHLEQRWNTLQPRLDNLVQTSFAISTATSTLQLTVQITPILLSALPILATVPLLNALLPDFLFNHTVLFFIMVGISAYAGYSKFKELETRAKLDNQIEATQRLNTAQQQQINRLHQRLLQLEKNIKPVAKEPVAVAFTPMASKPLRKVLSVPSLTEFALQAEPDRNQLTNSAPSALGVKL